MIRWWKRRRCLRRIADLEQALGLWPPWHYMREEWYTMIDGGVYYRLPTRQDIEHPPSWARERAA